MMGAADMQLRLSSHQAAPGDLNVPVGHYPRWVVVSAALHALLLFGLGRGLLVRLPAEQPPIRVTIVDPAPPPPPLGGNPNPVAPAVAEPPRPVRQVEPPVRPLKITRMPVHKSRDVTQVHEAPLVPLPPAASLPESDVAGSPDGGLGGVVGGTSGGQSGGTVGGRGDRVFRADEVAAPPVVVSQTMPTYPPLARARSIEGLVVLEGIVDRKGRVEGDSVTVVQSVAQLDEAAVSALRQWRFRAGRDGHGEPVRVIVQVPIRFRLR
jgi:protein TonB